MPLILRSSRDVPPPESYARWFETTGTKSGLPEDAVVEGLAARLEAAYDRCRDACWKLGLELAAAPGAEIARTPTVGAYGTDLRLMLAWSGLAEELAGDGDTTLAVCDDPWLFRHLAALRNVGAGRPPALVPALAKRRIRGVLSRFKVAASAGLAALRLRHQRKFCGRGDAVLLVYGHPASDTDGHDAYFGDLMGRAPWLRRMLHTDCPPHRALELARDSRTMSLHGWGTLGDVPGLLATYWKPGRRLVDGPDGWLVRRAAEIENSGGGPAMTRWQTRCQERWLRTARPRIVAWPWENFAWERNLCRTARKLGIETVGYQHTVVGHHQINFSIATNPDGADSLPDRIVCNGPAYRDELKGWGIPAERLTIGGAFRFERDIVDRYDPDGPVLVLLSGDRAIALQQAAAARRLADAGRRVLVKDHPMYPLNLAETPNCSRTDVPLQGHSGVAAVLFSTGTSGLEGLLSGIPTFRFTPRDRIAVDTLPRGVRVPSVTGDNVVSAIDARERPARLDWDEIFSPVAYGFWTELLAANNAAEQ